MNKLGKSFWVFRWGQLISAFGDQVAFMAVILYVFSRTGNAVHYALVILPATLLGLLFTLFASVLGDTFNRKKLIFCGSIFRAFVWFFLFFLLFVHHLSLWTLALLYMLSMLGSAVSSAGEVGILPEMISREKFSAGFNIISGTNASLKILGWLVAGILVSKFGIPLAFLFNAVSFFILSLCLLSVRVPYRSERKVFVFLWWRRFLQGLFHFFRSRHLIYLASIIFIIQFALAPLELAIPFFVKSRWQMVSSHLGVLLSFEGLGVLFSSVYLHFRRQKIIFMHEFLMALLSVALAYMGLSFSFSFWYVASLLLFVGFGIGVINILTNLYLLNFFSERLRSRLFSGFLFIEGLAMPGSLLLGGWIINYDGIDLLFRLMTALLLLASAAFYFLFYSPKRASL